VWGARCAGTAVAGWTAKCEAADVLGAEVCAVFPVVMLFRGGAEDWMVVRVVVIERTDGAGEENVLFLSPSVLATVILVAAPE